MDWVHGLKRKRVIVDERSKQPVKKDTFTDDELTIIETEFQDKIEIIPRRNEDEIRTREYVGYIVLSNNVIVIKPKIPGIGFLNMLRYALELPELGKEHPELTKGENYYDILVRFVFFGIWKYIAERTGYKNYENNLSCVPGKILFKEHFIVNHNINDKMYCSFSEVSSYIIENRIIKYTLFYLSHCYFLEYTIDAQLIRYYKRLDEVNLVSITSDYFKSIEYTPFNQHYRSILTLCELLLRDSALDEEIGEKIMKINMSKTATRFELGTPHFPNIVALNAAIRYISKIAIKHIEKRILSITDYLIDNLQKMNLQILSPLDRDESPDNSNRKQLVPFSLPYEY
jgi:hypothetical protein